MKKVYFVAVAFTMLLASCGTNKVAMTPAVESARQTVTSLEGQQVVSETVKLSGIEMADALNEDGTDMIKRPYKWFAATGRADNKQVAVEQAQLEAYATISRVLNNAVETGAERGNVVNNGRVMQSLTAYWSQFSASLQKACEPFGNVTIEYNPSTRMYEATAKVAIRGDRFNQLLNTAGDFKPADLQGEELEQFIEANKAIMEAARGN